MGAFAVIEDRIFTTVAGEGVFLSTDGGAHWTRVNDGLPDLYVYCLEVVDTYLFAGTYSGIFRTSDNGAHWAPASNLASVRALFKQGGFLYALSYGAGVFVSSDKGSNWMPMSTGLDLYGTCMAGSDKYLLVGTGIGTLYFSSNGGRQWTLVPGAITEYYEVVAVAICGESLIASFHELWQYGGSGAYVQVSTDLGVTWSHPNVGTVDAFATAGTTVLAATWSGVSLSRDSGLSWQPVGITLSAAEVLETAVVGNTVFAGAADGLYRTVDNGSVWQRAQLGWVCCLVSHESDLFAGNASGVYRSTDGGIEWLPVSMGLTKQNVVALWPARTALLAGTGDMTGGGVFRSPYSGNNWSLSNTGLGSAWVVRFIATDASLLAGTGGGGVYASTDDGLTWRESNVGMGAYTVNSFATSGTHIYAGTDNNGVFRSTDNGRTWTAVNYGLTNLSVRGLAAYRDDLFAGTFGGGVYRTTDHGTSWTSVSEGLSNGYVTTLSVSGTDLLAGTYGRGVWRRPLSEMTTSLDDDARELPQGSFLHQNYPNPFNSSTAIRYALPARSHVTLTIFNTLGQQAATLVQSEQEAGSHETVFEASGLASGVYLYRLQAGDFVLTRTMMLVR